MLLVRPWRKEGDIKVHGAEVSSPQSKAETAEVTDPGTDEFAPGRCDLSTSPDRPATFRTGHA